MSLARVEAGVEGSVLCELHFMFHHKLCGGFVREQKHDSIKFQIIITHEFKAVAQKCCRIQLN